MLLVPLFSRSATAAPIFTPPIEVR